MKLRLHTVANFINDNGRKMFSIGTVEGTTSTEKYRIVYASNGKYAIRHEGDSEKDQEALFSSPEFALAEVERRISE